MTRTLRVLSVEDSARDLALLTRHLSRAGYEPICKRVEKSETMREALATSQWDIVLCDYSMPQFGAIEALSVVQEMGLDIPFIIISGTVGEEVAVKAMLAGAHDYLMKDNLVRLGPTIERELEDAENRRARRQAEAKLKASEEQYHTLFEYAPDGILIADPGSYYLDANASMCRMLGYSRDEVIGRHASEIVCETEVPVTGSALSVLKARLDHHREWQLRRKDGSTFAAEVIATMMPDGNLMGMVRDVTERKQIEEEILRTNQRLEGTLAELQSKTHELASMTQQLWQASKLATMGELAASVAHELNNPLATVSLRLESLADQLAPDSQESRAIEIVADEVERMGKLVGSLLEFSRRGHQQVSTIAIGEEIEKSVGLIESYLRSRRIDVIQDFEADLPTIQADCQQLRQVFLNLLTNASDAMSGGGKLITRARNGRFENGLKGVSVEFVDAGQGIAPADLDKIWEPFFTTKPEGKGTGLGLAICRRVIEEHRGRIAIESRLGEGTTVTIFLPATNGEEEQLDRDE